MIVRTVRSCRLSMVTMQTWHSWRICSYESTGGSHIISVHKFLVLFVVHDSLRWLRSKTTKTQIRVSNYIFPFRQTNVCKNGTHCTLVIALTNPTGYCFMSRSWHEASDETHCVNCNMNKLWLTLESVSCFLGELAHCCHAQPTANISYFWIVSE